MTAMTPRRIPTRKRPRRLIIVVLALLVYLSIDIAMLGFPVSEPQWGINVDARGTITWVDPNGPANSAGLQVGDRLITPTGLPHISGTLLARQPVFHVRRLGTITWPARLGPTQFGQLLVLIGMLLLAVGSLVWAYGRDGRAPRLLALFSIPAALTLLGAPWGHDGYGWAMRLTFLSGVIVFPVAWAALFLSFPHDRLAERRWRVVFIALVLLASAATIAYALCLSVHLPYAIVFLLSAPVFATGLICGLVALARGRRDETAHMRQQRRIVAISAAGAMLPMLLLSFMTELIAGYALVSYEITAIAVVVLPMGLAYAIVRYDLMEIDIVVRRLVAEVLGGITLVGITALASLALRPLLPQTNSFSLAVAVLAGALGGRYVSNWARGIVERLLSPELMRSRRLLNGIDPAVLKGEEDLGSLAARLEGAAEAITGVPWARLMVRRRVSGAMFCLPLEDAPPVSMPQLTAVLSSLPWGVGREDARIPSAPDEWKGLDAALDAEARVLIPLRIRGEVIGLLAIGDRLEGEPLRGPDREALALLATHFTLAVDHVRVRTELEAEGADAAAFSTASMDLTASLADRAALPGRIVAALAALRGVRGVALAMYEANGVARITAERGEPAWMGEPSDLGVASFALTPCPHAWLPLAVGGEVAGALCVRWRDGHIIREHERRLLTVFANGAAMALEHARLYERARIQAERDPVTDLLNHRAFHTQLEEMLERARADDREVGLLLIDLADFKLFNDTHGHQAGDQALRRVAEVLLACCRTSDAAARLGGDEFAVLLPDSDVGSARAVAERITDLAAISALTSPEGHDLPVRLSIGVAGFPGDANAANALLARADERMYEAKRAGVPVSSVGRQARITPGDDGERFGILEALVAMVDNRDRYTAEHSEQVATYACALGAELGLSHETIETLRLAGLLHDVGKIGVPDRILRKPSRLTDEEFDIVRRHVELSEALLAVVSQDRDLRDAVRHHHERWDGQGYPRGLDGEEVPLLGRIMIIADAVSAMGMDRPYRKGLPWETIAHELRRGAGAQFDPMLVASALEALQQHVARAKAA